VWPYAKLSSCAAAGGGHRFNPAIAGKDKEQKQMGNIIYYSLDVLATSPEEINRIAARLKQPSSELLNWIAKRDDRKVEEIAQPVAELVSFAPVTNLFYVHESVNKSRRFENSFKSRSAGLVKSHLGEVSAEFPNAVFLLTHRDPQWSCSGKVVIRAGEKVQDVFDGDQQSQSLDWVLPDIFAPFLAEWNDGLPFGSLWAKWVEDAKAALRQLEENGRISNQQVSSKEVVGTSEPSLDAVRNASSLEDAAREAEDILRADMCAEILFLEEEDRQQLEQLLDQQREHEST